MFFFFTLFVGIILLRINKWNQVVIIGHSVESNGVLKSQGRRFFFNRYMKVDVISVCSFVLDSFDYLKKCKRKTSLDLKSLVRAPTNHIIVLSSAARRRSVIWYESCKLLCVSANLLQCMSKKKKVEVKCWYVITYRGNVLLFKKIIYLN